MCEENTSQKERFLQEVEQKLLRRDLDARPLEDGLIHIKWNEKPLCSVDRDGIVRFRPADITGSEIDRKLRTVTQVAAQVKECQLHAHSPAAWDWGSLRKREYQLSAARQRIHDHDVRRDGAV